MNEKSTTRDDRARAYPDALLDGPEANAIRLCEQSSTLVELLRHRARHQADAPAYVFLKDGETEEARLSYADLDRRARELAVWLRKNGTAGDRALLLYPPGLDFLVGFFGCLYAGVVAVPLYPPRPNRRDARIVDVARDAEARFVLTTSAVTANLERALAHSPELSELRYCATNELPEGGDDVWNADWPAGPDELAYLQYTSGSTRSPQGVEVSQANVLANVIDMDLGVRHPPDSVFVTWLPHFHDMGLVCGLLYPLGMGFPCYLMPAASFLQHPARWLSAISRYGGTHSGAPNFAYDLCTQRVKPEQKAELDLSRWLVAFNGAEPVRAHTVDTFAEAFAECGFSKAAFCPAYGLAEATLKVTLDRPGILPLERAFSSSELARGRVVAADAEDADGKMLVGCGAPETTEVLIVNPETLAPCAPDAVGEIWLRGPIVARGYWRRPQETSATFRATPDGGETDRPYLRTGDLGFMSEGQLFVVGRLKDLIIIRGRNHYPHDIEVTVESSHPAFRGMRAAAFSVDVGDEERLVVVQEVDRRHARGLDIEEVAGAVRRAITEEHELNLHRLAIVMQNGIPKTSSGKVQRRSCAQALSEGNLPIVAEWTEPLPVPPESTGLAASPTRTTNAPPQRDDIEDFLARKLASQLGVPTGEIDLEQPFSALGLDSARAMEFLGELETWLGRPLEPTLFWNYPTIATLAEHLSEAPSAPGGRSE